MINWEKIDHFTGEPYKKNPKSGLPNGNREVTKNGERICEFKTLKSAKAFAETL